MYTERDIQRKVSSAIKSVIKPGQEHITPEQLTEILTKSISSCILSHDFIDYVDNEFGKSSRRRT